MNNTPVVEMDPSGSHHDSSTSSVQEDDGECTQSQQTNSSGSHATGTLGSDSGGNSYRTRSVGKGQEGLFKKEGGALSGARCCFLQTILVAACALATVVSLVTSNSEKDDFMTAFDDVALLVIDTSNAKVEKVFRALETLSLTSTSFMKLDANEQDEYPIGFFTLSDVEVHLGNSRRISGASLVGYAPTVANSNDYTLWSKYSKANIGWVDEAAETLGRTLEEATDRRFFNPNIWTIQNDNGNGDLVLIDEQSSLTCRSPGEYYTSEERLDIVAENPKNGPFAPIWMVSPTPDRSKPCNINLNLLGDPSFRLAFKEMSKTKAGTFQDVCDSTAIWFNPQESKDGTDFYSLVTTPVWNDHRDGSDMVGFFFAAVPWETYFTDALDANSRDPVVVVMESQCGEKAFTFHIVGANVTLVDRTAIVHTHYLTYEAMAHKADFAYQQETPPIYEDDTGETLCASSAFTITVYPTEQFQSNYTTTDPLIYTLVVLSIFLFTVLAFCLFDCLVHRRQTIIMNTALRQNALVSSLFPKSIQKQLMEDYEETLNNRTGKARLSSFLNDKASGTLEAPLTDDKKSKPIADLFPETTIMFADIAGFTAWSSTREPTSVFTLLETIYAEFDSLAKRRRVFKVEVVGDCYVAVAGLPDPRQDHALVMAKFANDCLNRMFRTVRKLEVELGPDTAELGLRVGLHSGPVVAGVLRGDKSRFQLFGDTMNTASRMESNGVQGRIQVSQDTANLLIAAGKEHWLKEREIKITAKGKGELQTYFLQMDSGARSCQSSTGTTASTGDVSMDDLAEHDPSEAWARRNRVAEWTVEVMAIQLRNIVMFRKTHDIQPDSKETMAELERTSLSQKPDNTTVISEVAACIKLPDYSANKKNSSKSDASEIVLDADVKEELSSFVKTIAALYNDNPFHNFDHANHVVMSVNKLLSRINAPDLDEYTAKEIHDHTYGITSDPITCFACMVSALIHDVDHSGVPNAQLVKEGAPVSSLYHGKSVAEQNSFDIAWDLLLEPTYENLRKAIYVNAVEFKRFRQLVVNGVMATDIVDKDLKSLRNNRWDAAFDESKMVDENRARMLKATIVIEHLIQASDVAHTMQHWHIYRRWNERFFKECYQAFLDGRAEQNPAKTWYQGEIGFFDYYIIPLAKKLKECGVFGVSSDEYLSYATQNRKEWEQRGEDLVKEMVSKIRRQELSQAKRERHNEDMVQDQ